MKLASLHIENFRAFENETINFNEYTCLVGPNGGGKSTVLTALNILFRYPTDSVPNLFALDLEDFHHKNTGKPIQITATFVDLSSEAQEDFKNYCRQGKLIITAQAKWNGTSAPLKQYGQRMVILKFAPFFAAEGNNAKVEELKKLYSEIQTNFTELPPPGTKVAMITALREYEAAHPELHEPVLSEDEFYGVSKGKNLLEKYIEWVFVPAVKDVSAEEVERKTTALGQLLERTVRTRLPFSEPIAKLRVEVTGKYNEILRSHQSALGNLSTSLQTRLRSWAHPNTKLRLEWHSDPAKSVTLADPLAKMITGEGTFEGQLFRFGHGFQRSLLLALLQELASADQKTGPTLILACEEPELYQHPPQIRHLAAVFQQLASAGSQVVVCTHSPYFIKGEGCQDVRLARITGTPGMARVKHVDMEKLATRIEAATGKRPKVREGMSLKIAQVLQPNINEMFFTRVLILVEGLEDAAYITCYMVLMDRWEDFRRFGCHVVVTNGKSGIIQPLAIAKELEIPVFVVCDGDSHKCTSPDKRTYHENDNRALLVLCGKDASKPIPDNNIWAEDFVMWAREIDYAVGSDIGIEEWRRLRDQVKAEHDIVDVENLNKNTVFISHVLAHAWEHGTSFQTLDRLCEQILEFAKKHGAKSPEFAASINADDDEITIPGDLFDSAAKP